jgi:hypothetical protein
MPQRAIERRPPEHILAGSRHPARTGPLMRTARTLAVVVVLATQAAWAQGFELDLSDSPARPERPILVLPPVTHVNVTATLGGVETHKAVEKFDTAVHQRLVAAFRKELGAQVLEASAVLGWLKRQGLTATKLKSPAAVANLGEVAKALWVFRFEYNRPSLVATVFDASGTQAGESLDFDAAQGVTEALARRVAEQVHARLAGTDASAPEPVVGKDTSLPPPPVEELHDADLQVHARPAPAPALADPARERAVLLVSFGALLRGLGASGSGAGALVSLQDATFGGLGGFLRLDPLQWFAATRGKPWSALELDVHYGRALVKTAAVAGSTTSCPLIDDDLQARLSWRYQLQGSPALPSLGLGVGLSQEQSFAQGCTAAVPSLIYRGLDLQLRVRQPLYRDRLALDLALGPRVLFAGPQAPDPGFSFAGELWLEAKPVSVLFARAGVRLSRLALANSALGFTDLRTFVGLEAGAFL